MLTLRSALVSVAPISSSVIAGPPRQSVRGLYGNIITLGCWTLIHRLCLLFSGMLFTLARKLGIQYVWIDPISILQDDAADLRGELVNMA